MKRHSTYAVASDATVERLRELAYQDGVKDAAKQIYNEEQQAMVENATLAKVATKKVGDETMGDAAEAFVRDLVTRGKFDASTDNPVGYDYLWLGCALRDAFYAGVRWAETRPTSNER